MKAKIVMLETTDKSNISLGNSGKGLIYHESIKPDYSKRTYQNFYLIDPNAEIELNDYYYTKETNQIFQAYCESLVEGANNLNNCCKIIATSDKELNIFYPCNQPECGKQKCHCYTDLLPQLSNQSKLLLIDYYNREGKIPDEVEIKEENYCTKLPSFEDPSGLFSQRIKLNPQGEVDINITEEKMYSREEVDDLIRFMKAHRGISEHTTPDFILEQWNKFTKV